MVRRLQHRVEVVTQRATGEGVPAVVARQPGHPRQHPVDAELLGGGEVDRRHLAGVAAGLGADLDHVQQRELVEQPGRPGRDLRSARPPPPARRSAARAAGAPPPAAGPASAGRARRPPARNRSTSAPTSRRRRAVLQEPPDRPVEQPAELQVERRSGRRWRRRCPAPRPRRRSEVRSKTSRQTTNARATCSGVAPVSSVARNANVMPPRLTIELTTELVMISRRSGCPASWSPYCSRIGAGK